MGEGVPQDGLTLEQVALVVWGYIHRILGREVLGGSQASAILHVGTTMGMWVRASELTDLPKPEYTTENEARRIKCPRLD